MAAGALGDRRRASGISVAVFMRLLFAPSTEKALSPLPLPAAAAAPPVKDLM
jgi:hypothetical protein